MKSNRNKRPACDPIRKMLREIVVGILNHEVVNQRVPLATLHQWAKDGRKVQNATAVAARNSDEPDFKHIHPMKRPSWSEL